MRFTDTTPEMCLVLAAARATLTPGQATQLTELAAAPVAWDEVERLALRHGVAVLLCRHLHQHAAHTVPPAVLERLLDLKTQNAWRAFSLTEELCDVLTEFARQGVAALPYKGPVLGQTLYGDIALRQFNDLDILIKPDEVPQAALLLERRGYRNKYQLQPWQAQHLIKNDCEYNFFHAGQQVHLDLHWNFTPRYFTLRFDLDGIRQRARPVTLNGLAVNSLTPEDMLLVLAVNAAKDYWTKLLPLCDIAETVRQTPQLDWPQLWQRATATGAQRMLAISLALAQELWATPLPPWVQEKLSQDTAVARLTPHIKSVLFGPGLPPHSLASYLLPAQTLPNYAARLKFYLIFGWQPSFEDWGLMELPARLGFLYYLTRPIRLTVKYFWRGFSL